MRGSKQERRVGEERNLGRKGTIEGKEREKGKLPTRTGRKMRKRRGTKEAI